MTLQLQAKVHDLKKFRVLTYTYQILSEFQLAVCSKYVRSMFAVCSQYVPSMFAKQGLINLLKQGRRSVLY